MLVREIGKLMVATANIQPVDPPHTLETKVHAGVIAIKLNMALVILPLGIGLMEPILKGSMLASAFMEVVFAFFIAWYHQILSHSSDWAQENYPALQWGTEWNAESRRKWRIGSVLFRVLAPVWGVTATVVFFVL